jgi:uncharacterized repeat protein (TIGR01451 family)
MRRIVGILIPVVLAIGLLPGCSEDDAKPQITRLYASEGCGVAPLRVEFRGDASAGAPLDDPTGSNNWLSFTWNFGDGTVLSDATSVAYHEYQEPGTYTVTLTAEDNDGEKASRTTLIEVKSDSLFMEAFSLVDEQPATAVGTCAPIQFGITAESCDFDPVEDSYERFVFRWHLTDIVYSEPFPVHYFQPTDLGEQEVRVIVEDPTRSITRVDTVTVDVTESGGADLSIDANWLLSPDGPDAPHFDRAIETIPELLTYTIEVVNDGPDPAYNLEATGELDASGRIVFDSHVTSLGSFAYVQEDKAWTWLIAEIPASTTATLDITFVIEQAFVGSDFDFTGALAPYACDPDDDDLDVTATLEIIAVP